ncbi:MAG: ABC transporter substrate-binding protein [Actinomycetia bacterium]|nr:ABC transporter substrate-binding protein [Actinomycetes bacterium]
MSRGIADGRSPEASAWLVARAIVPVLLAAAVLAACSGGSDQGDTTDDSLQSVGPTSTSTVTGSVDSDSDPQTAEADLEGTDTVLRVGLPADAVGLRPWEDTCDRACQPLLSAFFDRLFELDTHGVPVGWLATEAVADESLTEWTVTLQPGVRFHDGTVFDAEILAAMWQVQQQGAVSAPAADAAGLIDVEVVDQYVVLYRLSAPNAGFPAVLAEAPLGTVFQPAAALTEPDASRHSPVGTGPYVAILRDPGNVTAAVRFDDYWYSAAGADLGPTFDELRFTIEPSAQRRVSKLLTSEFDVVIGTDLEAVGDAGISSFVHAEGSSTGAVFNTSAPPLDDARVRAGLALLVDYDTALAVLGGVRATQWFAPSNRWYDASIASAAAQDVERGTALLASYIADPDRSDDEEPGSPIEIELLCPSSDRLGEALISAVGAWSESTDVSLSIRRPGIEQFQQAVIGTETGLLGAHSIACWDLGGEGSAIPASLLAAFGPVSGSPENVTDGFDDELYGALASIRSISGVELDAQMALVGRHLAQEVPVFHIAHGQLTVAASDNIVGVGSWSLPEGSEAAGASGGELRWVAVAPA